MKILPNANAITVLVSMITLYGMLKSGVGNGSSKLVVRRYTGAGDDEEAEEEFGRRRIMAGAISNPRFASGGYSV